MSSSAAVPDSSFDREGPTRAEGAQRARILVVDDEPPARRLFARVLQRAGYDVEAVESA